MKKYLTIFIFFLLILTKSAFSEEKIVFIDINFIFINSDAGKDIKTQIKKKNNELQLEINEFKTSIESKRKKIISQKNVLSVEEYNKKVINLEKEITDMNSLISKKKNELNIFQKSIENNFSKNLNKIIEKFSVENSIDIILNKENLLMAKKNLDITEQIFKLFNDQIKKITIN